MKVTVGSIDYDLRVVDEPSGIVDSIEILGSADHMRNVIVLNGQMGDGMYFPTLLHELLHCLLFQGGIRDSGSEETERMLDILSHGIPRILKDNPWILNINGRQSLEEGRKKTSRSVRNKTERSSGE